MFVDKAGQVRLWEDGAFLRIAYLANIGPVPLCVALLILSREKPQGPPALPAAAAKEAAEDDQQKMQGTWKVVAVEEHGKKVLPDKIKGLRFVIAKDRLVTEDDGDKLGRESTYSLDPTRTPKCIDITTSGDGKAWTNTRLGIYELQGETLKICVREGRRGNRPTAFESKADSTDTLVILTREKP